jgi:glycerol kinase
VGDLFHLRNCVTGKFQPADLVRSECTPLGAALLAGWQARLYPGPDGFSRTWRFERSFRPTMPEAAREQRYRGWQDAVARALLAPG